VAFTRRRAPHGSPITVLGRPLPDAPATEQSTAGAWVARSATEVVAWAGDEDGGTFLGGPGAVGERAQAHLDSIDWLPITPAGPWVPPDAPLPLRARAAGCVALRASGGVLDALDDPRPASPGGHRGVWQRRAMAAIERTRAEGWQLLALPPPPDPFPAVAQATEELPALVDRARTALRERRRRKHDHALALAVLSVGARLLRAAEAAAGPELIAVLEASRAEPACRGAGILAAIHQLRGVRPRSAEDEQRMTELLSSPSLAAIHQVRRDALWDELKRLRAFADRVPVRVSGPASLAVGLAAAASWLPEDWVRQMPGLRVAPAPTEPCVAALDGCPLAEIDGAVHLPPDPWLQTAALHALAHVAEQVVPGLVTVERAWLARRDGPEHILPLGGPASLGGFADAIIGRRLAPPEPLAVGLAALVTGDLGGLTGTGDARADWDHAALVAGLLAVA